MARYFAGNSLAAFRRPSTAITEVTTAGTFDTSFVSSSIAISASNEYIETPTFSATGTLWVTFDLTVTYNGNQFPTGNGPTWYNGGTPVFRWVQNQSGQFVFYYWNGSAWTQTGSTHAVSTTRERYTIKIVLGSSFEFYSAGNLITSGSGWTGSSTTVTHLRLYPTHLWNGTNWYSQVMIADYDIRDSRLRDPGITGNSLVNNGAASGSFTDVNEVALNESTAISVQTVGNKAGQTKAAISIPVGYVIAAMVINARGRVSGGGVTDGKLGIRSGGANYSSSGRGYNTGYEPRGYLTPVDPATGGQFTQASFNAAEVFLEAS